MNSKSKEVFERIKQCCESACLGLGQSPYNRFLQSITPCREDLEVLQQDLEVLEIFENYARVFSNISFDEYLKTYCSEETKLKVKEWLDE